MGTRSSERLENQGMSKNQKGGLEIMGKDRQS